MPLCITPLLCPVWCRAQPPSFSRTTSCAPGWRSSRALAVERPTMPPPITAKSNTHTLLGNSWPATYLLEPRLRDCSTSLPAFGPEALEGGLPSGSRTAGWAIGHPGAYNVLPEPSDGVREQEPPAEKGVRFGWVSRLRAFGRV